MVRDGRGGGRRRPPSKYAELILGLGVLAAAAFVVLRPETLIREVTDPNFRIELREPTVSVSEAAPLVRVEGQTTAPAHVRVYVNHVASAEGRTGERNSFAFDNLPLRLGPNTVRTEASAAAPGPSVLGLQTTVRLRAPPVSKKVRGTVSAPAPQPSPSALGTRRVTAHLSYRKLRLEIEVTLPNADPRVVALVEGQSSLDEFVRGALSKFFVNGLEVDYRFRGVTPKIVRTPEFTTVTASSNPRLDDVSFGEGGRIEFAPSWLPVENAGDAFTLTVRDYTVKGLNPPPTLWTAEGATWMASRADLMPSPEEVEHGGERAKVVLARVTRSSANDPAMLFRQLRLTPYDVFPRGLHPLVAFALSFLAALPAIWGLGLVSCARGGREGTEAGSRPYLWAQRLARYLIALTFVPPVLFLVRPIRLPENVGAALESFYAWRGAAAQLNRDDLRALVLVTAAVWGAALLLRALARPREARGVRFWLWAVFRGVADAAAVVLFMEVALAAVLWVLPWNVSGLPYAATLALNLFGFVPALALAAWLSYKHHEELPLGLGPRGRAALTVVAVAVAALGVAVLAYPSVMPETYGKVQNIILPAVRDFFSLVRDWMPYGMLLAFAVLLRREGGGGGGPHTRYAVGKALFVAYVVGSLPNLFLVPVPLLIALWAFGKWVMADAEEQQRLDGFKAGAFGGGGLLGKVLKVPTMKDYQRVLDQYEQQVTKGELTLADFDAETKKIRDHVSAQKEVVKSEGGEERDARDVALALGPFHDNWRNGVWAARRGLLLSIPFAAAFMWELFQLEVDAQQSYPLLRVAGPALVFVLYWGVAAFFFGYYMAYLRGRTGLKKGGRVAAVVVLCSLPVWVASLGGPLALLLRVAQPILFFTALGAWADYHVFRRSLGDGFSWRKLMQFEETPALTTAASALLASVGALVTSSVTDQLGSLTTQIVTMAFQHSPAIIPGG